MDIQKHRGEIARALQNGKFEKMDDGRILVGAGVNAAMGGAFRHTAYHRDGSRDVAIDPNLIVGQALNAMLNTFFFQAAQYSAFYVSLFAGNQTPADGWTAANYDASANEFTGYAGERPAWAIGATPTTTKAVGNSGSEAMFTFAAGGPYNIYGAGIHTDATKESVTGLLIAATRFATPRLNQLAGDRLGVEYVLTAQDAG